MELPLEIITNILYRLPVKSPSRFRCVSKSWQAQLSEPQFIKHHQDILNHNHLIFSGIWYSNTSFSSSLYSLPCNQLEENPKKLSSELPCPDIFIFLGSCNGLVLGFVEDFINAHSLVIFNPTTVEFFILPESDYEMVNRLLEIDIMYGFGYDASTDDYKVVTISYFRYNYLVPGDNMFVHIYSLRKNTWKCGIDSPCDHSQGKNLYDVFVSGFLHWIANKGSDRVPVIVAFSLADEKFSELPSPNCGDHVDIMSKSGCKLVVYGEKLGLLMEDGVWLMNEYGVRESWSKILLIHGLHEISMVERMIFYEDCKLLLVSGGLIWIYDVEEGSFCRTIDISRNVTGLKVKGGYVESLVSPKFIGTN
ncbi:F-box/kelch-repeat protein At3g23880-like [Bidens hawaiensis]|uniref:F-box/kelch-repeat protein At3g23880-like n=1 Tax=Bidens hawaiensis TaxID=980011 RepID=UPI0040498DC8